MTSLPRLNAFQQSPTWFPRGDNSDAGGSAIYRKEKILKIRQLRDIIIVSNNYFNSEFKLRSEDKAEYFRKTIYRFDVPQIKNQYGKRTSKHKISTIFNKLPLNLLQITKMKEMKYDTQLLPCPTR